MSHINTNEPPQRPRSLAAELEQAAANIDAEIRNLTRLALNYGADRLTERSAHAAALVIAGAYWLGRNKQQQIDAQIVQEYYPHVTPERRDEAEAQRDRAANIADTLAALIREQPHLITHRIIGDALACYVCGAVSEGANDVQHRYCASCNTFHKQGRSAYE